MDRAAVRHDNRPRPIEERYWEKVQKGAPDECWPWLASQAGKYAPQGRGYGVIAVGKPFKGQIYAHRLGWVLQTGEWLSDDLEIDHVADVCGLGSLCQNARHMQPVSGGLNKSRAGWTRYGSSPTVCPAGHEREAGTECRLCRRATSKRYAARQKLRRQP